MNLAIVAVIGLAGLTFEPFLRTILRRQINLVLLALVVVDCPVVPARYWGMLIGFATGIKILPSAFILFLRLNGSGRRLAAPLLSSPSQSVWAPCSHHTTPACSAGMDSSTCAASARRRSRGDKSPVATSNL